jgi:hypothetical protein
MDRVTGQEHAHVMAFVDGGAGDEQGQRGAGRALGTRGGMDE